MGDLHQSHTLFLSNFQMYITNTVKARGTRLAKPVLCLGLMCLAFLTGINRVAEYRNHWSDVIAGFIIGISIAVFLVSVYLCHFCLKKSVYNFVSLKKILVALTFQTTE